MVWHCLARYRLCVFAATAAAVAVMFCVSISFLNRLCVCVLLVFYVCRDVCILCLLYLSCLLVIVVFCQLANSSLFAFFFSYYLPVSRTIAIQLFNLVAHTNDFVLFFSLFRFVAFFMRLTLGKYMCDWVKTGNMIRCVLCDTRVTSVCVCVPY